jgi:hypothetical protein
MEVVGSGGQGAADGADAIVHACRNAVDRRAGGAHVDEQVSVREMGLDGDAPRGREAKCLGDEVIGGRLDGRRAAVLGQRARDEAEAVLGEGLERGREALLVQDVVAILGGTGSLPVALDKPCPAR